MANKFYIQNKNLTNNLIRIIHKYHKQHQDHEVEFQPLPTLGTYPHSQTFLNEGVGLHEDRIYLNQAYHYLPWYKFLRKRKVKQELKRVYERLEQHERFTHDER